jgi:TldD protein
VPCRIQEVSWRTPIKKNAFKSDLGKADLLLMTATPLQGANFVNSSSSWSMSNYFASTDRATSTGHSHLAGLRCDVGEHGDEIQGRNSLSAPRDGLQYGYCAHREGGRPGGVDTITYRDSYDMIEDAKLAAAQAGNLREIRQAGNTTSCSTRRTSG